MWARPKLLSENTSFINSQPPKQVHRFHDGHVHVHLQDQLLVAVQQQRSAGRGFWLDYVWYRLVEFSSNSVVLDAVAVSF